jgi:hypothetical protein
MKRFPRAHVLGAFLSPFILSLRRAGELHVERRGGFVITVFVTYYMLNMCCYYYRVYTGLCMFEMEITRKPTFNLLHIHC